MGAITNFSTDKFSSSHTQIVIATMVGTVHTTPAPVIGEVNHLVRKSAHFTEYAILATLTCFAASLTWPRFARVTILALIISGLFAISDETHQIFVPSRGPSARDVLLDTLGAATAVFLYRRIPLSQKVVRLLGEK
jgi:VanZ family protein